MVVKLHVILRPLDVALMDANDVKNIAGESEKSSIFRKELTTQLQVLTEGLKTCAHIVNIALEGEREVKRQQPPDPHSTGIQRAPATEARTLEIRSGKMMDSPLVPKATSTSTSANTASSRDGVILVERYDFGKETIQLSRDELYLSQEDISVASAVSQKKKAKKEKNKAVHHDEK
jgi:hypothetical protein